VELTFTITFIVESRNYFTKETTETSISRCIADDALRNRIPQGKVEDMILQEEEEKEEEDFTKRKRMFSIRRTPRLNPQRSQSACRLAAPRKSRQRYPHFHIRCLRKRGASAEAGSISSINKSRLSIEDHRHFARVYIFADGSRIAIRSPDSR